jgi:hypothetical protein
MPIATILLTDTLDQWRQKDNQMVGVVNSLSSAGSILSITSQSAGQILVCQSNGTFANVTVTGDLTISSTGVATLVGGSNELTKGRVRFSGSMTSLY